MQACADNVEACEKQFHAYKTANDNCERWWAEMGEKEHNAYCEWKAMEEEYQGDAEDEGGHDMKVERSSSISPRTALGTGPATTPETEKKKSKDEEDPKPKSKVESKTATEMCKATEHTEARTTSKSGPCGEPPRPSKDKMEAEEDDEGHVSALRLGFSFRLFRDRVRRATPPTPTGPCRARVAEPRPPAPALPPTPHLTLPLTK